MSAEYFSEPEEETAGPPTTYPIHLTAEQLVTLRYVLLNSKLHYESQHRAFKALEAIGEAPVEEPGVGDWLLELIRDIGDLQKVVGDPGACRTSKQVLDER